MITLNLIIAEALRTPSVFITLRNALSSDLVVANPFQRQLVEMAGVFWDEHKGLPKPGDWVLWKESLPVGQAEGVHEALREIQSQPEMDWTPDYLSDQVINDLRIVAARNAVARMGQMVPDVDPESIRSIAEQVTAIEPVSIHGLVHLSDVEYWITRSQDDERRITTGIQTLDRFIGGWRQEFVLTLADTGIGKTTTLINFGKAAALEGARVFHITFELSAENTIKRYYRLIATADAPLLRSDPRVVITRVGHWLKLAKGEVHVLYQPAYSTGFSELQALVGQFSQLYGAPDLIILDYLDLMKPPPGFKSEYEALGRLSHQVRTLCHDPGATVISAAQANRLAHGRRFLRLDHIGDSYKKAQAADIVLGVVQTEEEAAVNQGRIPLLKVRENPGRGFEVPVYINMDYMLISDLDHPSTQRIIAELGHRPTPLDLDGEE